MRIEFELSNDRLKEILDASKSVPYIMLQCGEPSSPQERANRAWQKLAAEMGFIWNTVEPVRSKGQRFFTAEVICPGIDLGNGDHSGCNQSAKDCPTCGGSDD